MHLATGCGMFLAIALFPLAALAQDVNEALRKQVDQLQRQIKELGDRLNTLESTRPQTTSTPAPGTVRVIDVTGQSGQTAQQMPTLGELARPREPFSLYERRGAGQLLFDIGVAGDFVANFTGRNVDKANAGTFAGRENRFFPREVELALFGQVDPYARAEVRVEAGEEEAGEIALHLAEANLTLLTLPFGTQLKLGQMRNRFGLLNNSHEHDRPFIDQPNALTRFLGDEGLVERGAELTWVAPLPFFLEALAGVFDGDNETLFGRGKLNEPLLTGRLRTFFELGDFGAVQLGVSAASGTTAERRRDTILGADVKYKYTPPGWRHPLVTLGGEGLLNFRRVNRDGEDVDGDGVIDTQADTRTRRRWGGYAWAEVQPFQRWAFGTRGDWTEFPETRGREWAIEPYVTFWPSEFLRFRLGYKHTDRDKRDGFTDNESSARSVWEVLLQATFILGAHPAHPF